MRERNSSRLLEFAKKAAALFGKAASVRFAAIDAEKARFGIRMMCRAVSPGGDHAWRSRSKSKRAVENERLAERVSAPS
jgi:hypothetical protein